MKKVIIYLAIIGLIIWGMVSLGKRQPPKPQPGEREIEQPVSVPAEVPSQATVTPEPISYPGKDGVDALTLLKEKAEIETQDFGDKLYPAKRGELVTAINGVKGDDKNFWALYVNDKMTETGASELKTKTIDKIEWRYQPLK